MKKDIHKHTWMSQDNGRIGGKESKDGLCDCLQEGHQIGVRCESFERGRGIGGMADHFLMEGKLRV